MTKPNLSRRGFIGAAAATGMGVAAASTLGPLAGTAHAALGVAGPDAPSNALGIQLYSVRNAVASFGFRAVFEELARIGFKEVEFAGYTSPASPGITVQELRTLLDANGLQAVGVHIGRQALLGIDGTGASTEATRATQRLAFEQAVVLGMPHVGTADDFAGLTVPDITAEGARFSAAGAVAASFGLKLYQHNHANEFSFTRDDLTQRRHDVFLSATDPSLVFLELDILWAHGGARKFALPGPNGGTPAADGSFGFDPAAYVARAPQRYPLFHVKDGRPFANPTQGNSFQDVEFGTGTIPYRQFFDTIGARSYHHGLYEQDSGPSTPAAQGGALGAALRSFANMHTLRTLTWMDELVQMVERYEGAGRISASAAASLTDRLVRALDEVEGGSETRTRGYLSQFVARANNQIKGGQDVVARALLVQAAEQLIVWLDQTEAREDAL